MAGRFILSRASDGMRFKFNLKAANGEIILSSELYSSKAAAQNGINSVKINAPSDARYERFSDRSGNPRFNLKAANGEVIGISEGYSSTGARETGIASVKTNAPSAEVIDIS